jgi:hypothetical protein
MGALFDGRCFDTAAEAAAAMWSGASPVISAGSPPFVSVVEFGSGWQVSTYQSGSLVSVQALPSVAFASCDVSASLLDGVALGWLVALVWAAVWGISVLRGPLSWR